MIQPKFTKPPQKRPTNLQNPTLKQISTSRKALQQKINQSKNPPNIFIKLLPKKNQPIENPSNGNNYKTS